MKKINKDIIILFQMIFMWLFLVLAVCFMGLDTWKPKVLGFGFWMITAYLHNKLYVMR